MIAFNKDIMQANSQVVDVHAYRLLAFAPLLFAKPSNGICELHTCSK
jgi:hypothetical protein